MDPISGILLLAFCVGAALLMSGCNSEKSEESEKSKDPFPLPTILPITEPAPTPVPTPTPAPTPTPSREDSEDYLEGEEIDSLPTDKMKLKCAHSCGEITTSSTLTGEMLQNGIVVNVKAIEFKAFEKCSTISTKMKCIPTIEDGIWKEGIPIRESDGEKLVSKKYSYMFCTFGRGEITIVDDGQIEGEDEDIEEQGMYGIYTKDDYDYLVALGGEAEKYDGFVAVAYVLINRAQMKGLSLKEATQDGFGGFNEDEIGKPRNEEVAKAALDVLQENVENPIGEATQFLGAIYGEGFGYDLWYEKNKCTFVKEIEGNVFYNEEAFGYVHNYKTEKTDDAVIIFDVETREWKLRGLIVGE